MSNLNLSIESMLPEITESVALKLRERALASLEYQVTEAVREEVKKYITDNIIPAVNAELESHATEFRAVFVEAVRQSVVMASSKIVEKATEKMASYEGDKIVGEVLRAMFGRGY